MVLIASRDERNVFYVTDVDALAPILDAAWHTRTVTAEMDALFVFRDGTPALLPGDRLRWYSRAGVPDRSPSEALRRTVGYDVDHLMAVTGWGREQSERWADRAPPVKLEGFVSIGHGDISGGEWVAQTSASAIVASTIRSPPSHRTGRSSG